VFSLTSIYISSFVFENDFAALKKEEIEFEESEHATFFKVKPERGISRVVCF
jgi:UDPglucose--hexose-1-phosphate uridylyltransferase